MSILIIGNIRILDPVLQLAVLGQIIVAFVIKLDYSTDIFFNRSPVEKRIVTVAEFFDLKIISYLLDLWVWYWARQPV